MSLRSAIRSRFRGDKDKDNKEGSVESRESSPWRAENEPQEEVASSNKTTNTSPDEESLASSPGESKRHLFSNNSQGSNESRPSLRDMEEKSVYEMQLNHLQEQLVAAMIENQNLSGELQNYKEKHEVDRIMKDLEYERLRNQQLQQQLDDAKHNRSWSLRRRKMQRTATEPTDSESRAGLYDGPDSLGAEWVDVAQEATEGLIEPHEGEGSPRRGPRATRDRVYEWLVSTFYEVMADFTEESEVETQEDSEGDPLTVKKLKENIKRFRNDAKPIVGTVKGVRRLLMWRSPSVTLIAFVVYMYSVWIGWLVPVVLFMMIFRLSLNYLTYRGWNINIVLLAEPEDEDRNKDSETFKDLGMSDKFNLVVQVARQVQNILGKLADNLEKLKNLLMWRQPESTMQLYLTICVGFILSCVLPGKTLFTLIALYGGIKMFIIEYIFTRFPRMKRRHDSTYRIWKGLPTDSELEKQYQKAAIDRPLFVNLEDNILDQVEIPIKPRVRFSSVLPVRPDSEPTASSEADQLHDDDKGFCDLFTLPIAEHPLPGWRGGRRCTLINKDKSLTAAFKHGKLYLTRSFLCFERSKTTAMKNIVIPLSEITKVEKAKPYAWMPGGGMSIEVTVQDQDKPYMFGAILNRDECFDSIVAVGLKAGLLWANEFATASSSSPVSSPTTAPNTSLSEGTTSPTEPTVTTGVTTTASTTSAASSNSPTFDNNSDGSSSKGD